jgi:hypothetical protein
MAIAALITWLITAVGGFVMLGMWIRRGGHRAAPNSSTTNTATTSNRLPAMMVFAHFALAVVGLLLWIGYLITETSTLAWSAFVVLLPVAVLGFVMFARWVPVAREKANAISFPIPVVLGHGLFAATTLVLVLLTSLNS